MNESSNSDTQYGCQLLRDEETPRTRNPRAQQACKRCRSRKSKCDGISPCKACEASGKPCEYENTPTTKEERGLNNITEIATETLRVLRAIASRLEGPSTSPLHPKSLEVSREIHTKLFSSQKLYELSETYIKNVHVLYPMFHAPSKMCVEFIEKYGDTAAIRRDSITPCLQNANVLLLLALGSCKSISDSPRDPGILPGMTYYTYAQDILARKREKMSFALAQTMILATLYTNQIGMLRESWATVSCACRIYLNLGSYVDVPNDVSALRSQNHPISEETKRSSWICRELAHGIDGCLNFVSANLAFISGSDTFPGECPEEGPEMVYATRVLLRILLEGLHKLAPTDFATTGGIDEEDLKHLTSLANDQIMLLENWRSELISRLAWADTDPPSTDPLMASFRAEYYKGIVKLLRPYLEIVRNCECFPDTMDKLSAGQRGLVGVVQSFVKAALSSIIALDRIGAVANSAYEPYQSTSNNLVMLSNPVETLHAEFQNVLVLQAIHSSAIYPLSPERTQLTETTLDALHLRTVDRLSRFWPNSPLLTLDLQILRVLRPQRDSVAVLDLVSILAGVSSSRK